MDKILFKEITLNFNDVNIELSSKFIHSLYDYYGNSTFIIGMCFDNDDKILYHLLSIHECNNSITGIIDNNTFYYDYIVGTRRKTYIKKICKLKI